MMRVPSQDVGVVEKEDEQMVAERKEGQGRPEREGVDGGKKESKGKEERRNEGAGDVAMSGWDQGGA